MRDSDKPCAPGAVRAAPPLNPDPAPVRFDTPPVRVDPEPRWLGHIGRLRTPTAGIVVNSASALAGRLVAELELPSNALIALVRRDRETLVPRGDTRILDGDRLTVVGDRAAIAWLARRWGEARESSLRT